MPLWGWLVLGIAVLLALMWWHDRRVRARGSRLNDSGTMRRGVMAPHSNPDAHRGFHQGGG